MFTLKLTVQLLGDGRLRFWDPKADEHLPTYEDLKRQRDRERANRLAAKLQELDVDPDPHDTPPDQILSIPRTRRVRARGTENSGEATAPVLARTAIAFR